MSPSKSECETSDKGEETAPPSSPLLINKKTTGMAKSRPALGARIRTVNHHHQHQQHQQQQQHQSTVGGGSGSATTVNLFVEGMHSVEARTQVEQALLRKEGVISFFSDIADQKIVIRTTLSVEELYAYIWDTCRMRASTIKGDYSGFKPNGYLDDSGGANKGGWLWGISSLLQIIAVKNDGKQCRCAPDACQSNPGQEIGRGCDRKRTRRE